MPSVEWQNVSIESSCGMPVCADVISRSRSWTTVAASAIMRRQTRTSPLRCFALLAILKVELLTPAKALGCTDPADLLHFGEPTFEVKQQGNKQEQTRKSQITLGQRRSFWTDHFRPEVTVVALWCAKNLGNTYFEVLLPGVMVVGLKAFLVCMPASLLHLNGCTMS